ncbi:hypothetical protein niasHT_019764 [Heterodera trifolii]|uniref:Uncharacterized protein n=1 Tax=Heterodera trifolii TaxID=157864 RepID=A0ABD2LC42_9BILA
MPLLPLSHQKPYGSRIPTTKSSHGTRERRLTIDLGSAMFSSSPASTANLGPSRSQTPTNPMNSMPMNGSFTLTLPRDKPNPAPKCFGKSTHMLKEDYEKERVRWEKKLEEAEQKLSEAAVHNSELFQLKAELNRKIIDFEKSQRPLIEQNRRLNERIKAANGESRNLEEQLAHVQDELLSLKDAYERVQKENASLRELRAFPEKLEELSRYRAQVLEMSKCITALRQSAAEKDRRHELLVMKMKRMRKSAMQESDRQSCTAGSEGSVEDSGSIGLDTITEDLDEEVELSAAFAIIGDGRGQNGEFVLLRQQLEMASDAVAELQRELERVNEESAQRMNEETDRARRELEEGRKRERKLEQQLANTTALNDLLEFQLVELTATKQQKESAVSTADKMCATDVSLPVNEHSFEEEPKKWRTLEGKGQNTADLLPTVNEALRKTIRSVLLSREDKLAIRQAMDAMEFLHNKKSFLETELNMAQCEMERMRREMDTREREWGRQREEVLNERRQKKRELKTELEQLRKEKSEETGAYARQVEELSRSLSAKIHTITDLTDRLAQFGAELDICRCQLTSSQAENGTIKEQIGECLKQKDKAERELNRLRAEKEEAKEKLIREREERRVTEQKAETELIRLRTYNRELEGQFNAQMEMLGALKRKLLAIKDKEGSTGKGGGGATRSCGSTEDEQYHSEGSDESTANGTGRTAAAKVRWSQK